MHISNPEQHVHENLPDYIDKNSAAAATTDAVTKARNNQPLSNDFLCAECKEKFEDCYLQVKNGYVKQWCSSCLSDQFARQREDLER